jgi:hypothetical protein
VGRALVEMWQTGCVGIGCELDDEGLRLAHGLSLRLSSVEIDRVLRGDDALVGMHEAQAL